MLVEDDHGHGVETFSIYAPWSKGMVILLDLTLSYLEPNACLQLRHKDEHYLETGSLS